MKENDNILKNVDFWLQLSERYFEASTTEEEESLLKRFVTSDYAQSDLFDDNAKEVFQEVMATMSLISVGRTSFLSQDDNSDGTLIPIRDKAEEPKRQNAWRWMAGAAAVLAFAFLLRGVFTSSDSHDIMDVCVAYNNGTVITDKDEVLSMMRDSWTDIDIHASSTEVVESQLKEMFDVLE